MIKGPIGKENDCAAIMGPVPTVENTMKLIGHTVGFKRCSS